MFESVTHVLHTSLNLNFDPRSSPLLSDFGQQPYFMVNHVNVPKEDSKL